MKLTLESTDQIVTLNKGGVDVPARVWIGQTEAGVKVHCFITNIAVSKDEPPAAFEQFEKELKESHVRPNLAIPLRYFID